MRFLFLVPTILSAQSLILPGPGGRAVTGGGGGSFTVTLVAQSNTQAMLSYTAPSTSACEIKVSESPSYSPLVNDVNSSLFSGGSSDNRDGNLGAGTTSRVVVVGQRKASYAGDGKKYSRALQAYTTHYFKATCGSDTGTKTFTTLNIPGGMTYADIPSADALTLGDYTESWMIPTHENNNRSLTVIDQYTGAYRKAVTIIDDKSGSPDPEGFNMTSGAFVRVCTAGTQTTPGGKVGIVCQFLNQGPSKTSFYFIEYATGDATFLGSAHPSDTPPLQLDTNMCFIGNHTGDAVRYCYIGDYTEPGDKNFPVNAGTLVNDANTSDILFAYDPTYDSSLFGCGSKLSAITGQYQSFFCGRGGGQDSYGWWGVYSPGDGRAYSPSCTPAMDPNCPGIVAAMPPMSNPRTRFCGAHNFQWLPNYSTNPTVPTILMNWHGMNNNGNVGTAAWQTTFNANASGGATSIVLATKPVSQFGGGDTFDPGNPVIGDVLFLPNGQERITITSVSGTGPFTVGITPALANGYVTGDVIRWDCNATNTSGFSSGWMLTFWKFLADPSGGDTTNTNLVFDRYMEGGGHYDTSTTGLITEQGQIFVESLTTGLDNPESLHWNDSPTFHGLGSYCFGGICPKHPSWHQTTLSPVGDDRNNYTDQMTFNGGPEPFFSLGDATVVTGTLYKYGPPTALPYNVNYAANKTVLFRKVLPTIAITGGIPYLDVSGPGSTIVGTSGDNFKYCVAYLANECVSGSAAGDIYFNHVGTLTFKHCTFADGAVPDRQDVCIAPAPAYASGVPQILSTATDTTNATRRTRMHTSGPRGIRQQIAFAFVKNFPDNSWYLLPTGFSCTSGVPSLFCNIWVAKNTPFPAQDAYDRSDFIPTTTGTITGGGSVNNAIVKFGYLEFGTSSQFYCTSRAESCYANAAAVPAGANPFSYPSDGSSNTLATLTGVACSTTCTIDVPALSGHTLYYQIIKRDASNSILSTGTTQIAVIP